jgi:alpha,alpha-trehalose phosphorylase (configuration-retaining)
MTNSGTLKDDSSIQESEQNTQAEIEEQLAIQAATEKLAIPTAMYTSIQLDNTHIHIAEMHHNELVAYKTLSQESSRETTIQKLSHEEEVLRWLKSEEAEHQLRCIAASTREQDFSPEFRARLWLEKDIVPFVAGQSENSASVTVEDQVTNIHDRFTENDLVKVPILPDREVVVSTLATLEDYRQTATAEDFQLVQQLARAFAGKRLVFISATPQGGGVALMRHALIRFLRLLNIDAHWHVLLPNKDIFEITKSKFHNVLQAVASPDCELTEEEMERYQYWTEENALVLTPAFTAADVVVIDDPQPVGLIPFIKAANPEAKILYRSHIQIVASLVAHEGTPQHKTWSYLWNFIQQADYFISHPLPMFVPATVPADTLLYMPATTDALDGLNKPLSEAQMNTYLTMFNTLLLQEGQTPLDPERAFLVQLARFDPSKGIPDVLDAYRQMCERLKAESRPLPQLVIAGNGSVDDPDGVRVRKLIGRILQTEPYSQYAEDIKVVSLPHNDQILNTLLRKSTIALQLSIKEGFEIKVTEALLKGKPVIAYRVGGIPLQLQDGVSGHLVDVGNTTQVAQHLYDLLTDPQKYQSMSEAAAREANHDYLTVPNAINWLYLAVTLLKGDRIEGNAQWVLELARQFQTPQQAA